MSAAVARAVGLTLDRLRAQEVARLADEEVLALSQLEKLARDALTSKERDEHAALASNAFEASLEAAASN